MAEAMQEEFVINVRLNSHASLPVRAQRTWSVGRLKQALQERNSTIKPEDVRIVFQGRVLKDADTFALLDLGNFSYVHAVKGKSQRTVRFEVDAQGGEASGLVGAARALETEREAEPEKYRNQYFVYCKNPCKEVCAAKLRVRCATCKQGSFVVTRGPNSWEDVLEKGRIKGQCQGGVGQGDTAANCPGDTAEFYFKCSVHQTSEGESTVPLPLIQSNSVRVECLGCGEKADVVLVFNCEDGHASCIDCFQMYAEVAINNRDFEQHEQYGFTLGCPNKCANSAIKEPHHFRVLGQQLYERYQKMGTETYILQAGGILCPGPDCGNGMFPECGMRKIKCDNCKITFCKECQYDYHEGPCENLVESVLAEESTAHYEVDPRRAQRARWDRAAEDTIRQIAKLCPECRSPTEKNEGCNHMTCPATNRRTGRRCGFEWCWVCVKAWSRQCQGSHWFPNR